MLEFLVEEINYPPITVYCDYVGAIYLSYNAKISNRTKHVNTRIHFVRNNVEDNTIKITFVKSEDNDADVFTKNVSENLFDKNTEKFMSKEFN